MKFLDLHTSYMPDFAMVFRTRKWEIIYDLFIHSAQFCNSFQNKNRIRKNLRLVYSLCPILQWFSEQKIQKNHRPVFSLLPAQFRNGFENKKQKFLYQFIQFYIPLFAKVFSTKKSEKFLDLFILLPAKFCNCFQNKK